MKTIKSACTCKIIAWYNQWQWVSKTAENSLFYCSL